MDQSHAYHHLGNLGVQIMHQTIKELLRKPDIWESLGLPRNGGNFNSTILRICLQHYQQRLLHVNPLFESATWGLVKAFRCLKDIEVGRWRKPQRTWLIKIRESAGPEKHITISVSCGLCKSDIVRLIQTIPRRIRFFQVRGGPESLKAALSPYGLPAFASISLPMISLLLGNGARPNSENSLPGPIRLADAIAENWA